MDVYKLFMCYQYTRNESEPPVRGTKERERGLFIKTTFSQYRTDMLLEESFTSPDNIPACKFSPLSTSSLNLSCLTIIC